MSSEEQVVDDDGVQQTSEFEEHNEAQQNDVVENQIDDDQAMAGRDEGVGQELEHTEDGSVPVQQEEAGSSHTDMVNGGLDTNHQGEDVITAKTCMFDRPSQRGDLVAICKLVELIFCYSVLFLAILSYGKRRINAG